MRQLIEQAQNTILARQTVVRMRSDQPDDALPRARDLPTPTLRRPCARTNQRGDSVSSVGRGHLLC